MLNSRRLLPTVVTAGAAARRARRGIVPPFAQAVVVGLSPAVLLQSTMAAAVATELGVRAMAEGKSADELRILWAEAYEAWVAPPGVGGCDGGVLYLMPEPSQEAACQNHLDQRAAGWLSDVHKKIGPGGRVLALTAFNPMGEDHPHDRNVRENDKLAADIESLCAAGGCTSWRSFGFAEDWHEKGFCVFAAEGGDGVEENVVALARKYKQGAIYRFYLSSDCDPPKLMRATVPAMLSETEAAVALVPTSRPPWPHADPDWAP